MLGGKVEGDAVSGVAQEGFARRQRFEDAGLALHSKLLVQAAAAGDQPDHALREVDVEVVADDVPAGRVG
jgi:hypothetical protein